MFPIRIILFKLLRSDVLVRSRDAKHAVMQPHFACAVRVASSLENALMGKPYQHGSFFVMFLFHLELVDASVISACLLNIAPRIAGGAVHGRHYNVWIMCYKKVCGLIEAYDS